MARYRYFTGKDAFVPVPIPQPKIEGVNVFTMKGVPTNHYVQVRPKEFSMITPTVGRIVHFYENAETKPLAAIVSHVVDERKVHLCVVNMFGYTESRQNVPLVQDGEERPANSYFCEWMAYQKGQAAKTEAAENGLAQKVGELEKELSALRERLAAMERENPPI